ncbi:MAG TPA: phosphotriesterase [Stenotrophomonas sp.]|nr:phosphotriesterase [Stenotrophomonas sp.]
MLRFIHPGDVFCFTRNDGNYYFGQIVSEALLGHHVRIFDLSQDTPEIAKQELLQAKEVLPPLIVDSYSIFDRKANDHGDWRIIGRLEVGDTSRFDAYFFCYGTERNWKKVDAMGMNERPISDEEAMTLQPMVALNDFKFWLAFDAFRQSQTAQRTESTEAQYVPTKVGTCRRSTPCVDG